MTATDTTRKEAGELVAGLTAPTGIVLVGASADLTKPSGRPLDYLRRYGYTGRVQVVNPRHREIVGFPCVPTVADIEPGSAQAAIVSLPAPRVTAALRDLASVRVEVAVVIGSGFEDCTDGTRRELDKFLATPGRRMRVIGPNCVGTMSIASGAQLNFSSVLQTIPPRLGGTALVTQSGASGNGLLMSLLRRGSGVAHWFSTGDELDVGALELIVGLLPRDDVACIGLFIEGVTDIEWLPQVRRVMRETGKPVYLVKIADSDLGQVAAGGHTGRVVGSSDISRAVLAQSGFVRVDSVDQLTDCLVAHEIVGRLPRGASVAGVSVSGAGGVILADQVQATKTLAMPVFGSDLADDLDEVTGARVVVRNPLDVPFLGETETFARVLAVASERSGCDVVIAVESSLAHDRDVLANVLLSRAPDAAPVVLSHLSENDPINAALVARLADARVAVIPTPERAVRATALLVSGVESAGPEDVPHSPAAPHGNLLGLEAVAALLPAGFPWAPWRVVAHHSAAAAAGAAFGLPLAVKAAGRTIAHRSDVGAVEIVRYAAGLEPAYSRVSAICAEHGDAVVIQQGAPPGHDVLLALLRDPEYGLTAVVRLGGLFAELLDEQVVLWHGWDPAIRSQILRSSRIGALLIGYRGGAAVDIQALEDLIELTLRELSGSPVSFVEFNPVVVASDGVHVVDALASMPETE